MGSSDRPRGSSAEDVGVLEMGVHDVWFEVAQHLHRPTAPTEVPSRRQVEGPHLDPPALEIVCIPDVGRRHEADDAHLYVDLGEEVGEIDEKLLGPAGTELVDDMRHAQDAATLGRLHVGSIGTAEGRL